MQLVNVNQLVHSASPFFMGVGLQSWVVAGKTIQSGQYGLGVVLSVPRKGFVAAELRLIGPYLGTEKLVIAIRALELDGSLTTLLSTEVTASEGSGNIDLLKLTTTTSPSAGDAIYADLSYVPGGTPLAPVATLVVQIG